MLTASAALGFKATGSPQTPQAFSFTCRNGASSSSTMARIDNPSHRLCVSKFCTRAMVSSRLCSVALKSSSEAAERAVKRTSDWITDSVFFTR